MTERNDVLVADYLSRVSRATAGLPPEQRDELLRDLREHIETGRAELDEETEAQVRDILERLGEPAVIARAAAEDAGLLPAYAGQGPAYAMPAGMPPQIPVPAKAADRSPVPIIITIAVIAVVIALCLSALFFGQSSEMPAPAPAVPS
nr:hypothetical protein [uncultured Actinoplanes sp.]